MENAAENLEIPRLEISLEGHKFQLEEEAFVDHSRIPSRNQFSNFFASSLEVDRVRARSYFYRKCFYTFKKNVSKSYRDTLKEDIGEIRCLHLNGRGFTLIDWIINRE